MKIFVPKETDSVETRAALDPAAVKKLTGLGAEISIETGAGDQASHRDSDFEDAGATVSSDRDASLGDADIVLRVRKPAEDEVAKLKSGSIHISFLDPFN